MDEFSRSFSVNQGLILTASLWKNETKENAKRQLAVSCSISKGIKYPTIWLLIHIVRVGVECNKNTSQQSLNTNIFIVTK